MLTKQISNFFILLFFCTLSTAATSYAGPVNPNISVIGQIIGQNTDDAATGSAGKTSINMGETEIQCDAYLNPYAKGVFVFSVDTSSGASAFSVEEAYMTIFKGLPDGMGIRLGKYRVIFEAPRVLTSMLPGDDGYNETAAQVSYLLPMPGSWASVLSADITNGSSFHPTEAQSASGWVARWSNSFLIDDVTPLEIGMSATQGTNSVLWGTKTTVTGADFKTKIPLSVLTKLTLQGEYYKNQSDVVNNPLTGSYDNDTRSGFYAFGDVSFWERWNGGLIYDQYNPEDNKDLTNKAIKGFLGYSLLEETTLLRLTYENFIPQGADVNHTVMLQVLFSMGPHKAHQY
jgi:hypothetical protein